MENSKLNPEENNSNESFPDVANEINKEEKINEFTEFLEKASDQVGMEEKKLVNIEQEKKDEKKSIINRILNEGFDGISTNPNYKMLGLLIILLINLSLFFVIGNIGKTFLKNAGIM